MTNQFPFALSSANARRRVLRDLIAAPEVALLPGVFDGFSLKLVEDAGFAAGFITGSGVSESRHVLPDIGLIGFAESLAAAAALASRSDVALIADGDTGYGGPVNVFQTVRAFEAAGLAGLLIEDQEWPKKCGHMDGKRTIPSNEMVMKVRAAVDARYDDDFVILARTDAAATEGIDAAIERARMYADAGADIVFADALLSEKDIEKFAASVDAPVLVNMGFGLRSRATTPLLSPTRLRELGVAVAIYPRMLTAASVTGIRAALQLFRDSEASLEVPDRPDLLASFDEIHHLVNFDQMSELEDRYAVPEVRA